MVPGHFHSTKNQFKSRRTKVHLAPALKNCMVKPFKPRKSSQNWKTFLSNHSSEIYACGFFTHQGLEGIPDPNHELLKPKPDYGNVD